MSLKERYQPFFKIGVAIPANIEGRYYKCCLFGIHDDMSWLTGYDSVLQAVHIELHSL